LSAEAEARVYAAYEAGASWVELIRRFKCSRSTLARIVAARGGRGQQLLQRCAVGPGDPYGLYIRWLLRK
jgi:Mor family transcriptional regulator